MGNSSSVPLLRDEDPQRRRSFKQKFLIPVAVIGIVGLFILVLYFSLAKKNSDTSIPVTPKYCNNIPEGLKRLNRAVDITNMEILPISSSSKSVQFGRAVFEFTCNNDKNWTDPLIPKVYDMPDQVEVINSLTNLIVDTYISTCESSEEVKMNMASNVNVNFIQGMFSASANYRRAQEFMANNSKFIVEATAFFSAFQADLTPYWTTPANKNFLQFVKNQLPKTYQENPDKYNELIREYGTHYFTGGYFGGLFRLSILLDKNLNTELSEKDIRIAVNATFFNYLRGIGAHSDEIHEVNSKFTSLSQVTERYYGGNVPIEGPAEWNKWSQTVPKNPWLLSGKLSEITNLIPDGDGKKEAVALAIETYLAVSYLKDLMESLNYYLKRNKIEEKNKKTVNTFIKHSEDILRETLVDVPAAKSLALEVKQFLHENEPIPDTMSDYGIAEIVVISANVPNIRKLPFIKPDPFVKVYASDNYIGRTTIESGTTRPYWNDRFASSRIHPIHVSSSIRFDIYDENAMLGDVLFGTISISIKDILQRKLNATQTSLNQFYFNTKITWLPFPISETVKPIN